MASHPEAESAAEQLELRSRLLEYDRIIAIVVDCPTQWAEIVHIWVIVYNSGARRDLGMVPIVILDPARLVDLVRICVSVFDRAVADARVLISVDYGL